MTGLADVRWLQVDRSHAVPAGGEGAELTRAASRINGMVAASPFGASSLSNPADFDVKERVRSATDIVDVIGRDLELRPQGRNMVARCPFHNDKRPSMTVNPERQTWKCWVCDVGGDVFSYLMKREGVDFPTALKSLAEAAGIELPRFQSGPKTRAGSPDDRPTLLAALELVANAYFDELATGQSADAQIAREYLAARGIDDENRIRFRIGFAPDSWDFACELLRRNQFSEAVARATGLVIARSKGTTESATGSYDRFRGRLMFPIHNAQGQVISLGGRIIPSIAERIAAASSDASSGGAKYINGPETLLFRKSNELYGLDLAKDAIRAADQALVMEGYTDVIAARMAGIEPVVAVLGTALTERHIGVLKRYARRVVLVLDGDDAGRRRADEVLGLFVKADADLRVLTLPDGADPADFLTQHSAATLNDMVAAAPDAMQHKLTRLTTGLDVANDTHGVTTAVETMLSILAQSPAQSDKTSLKIDQMIGRMASVFGLPADRLSRRLAAIRETTERRQSRKTSFTRSTQVSRDVSLSGNDAFAMAAAEDAADWEPNVSGATFGSRNPVEAPLSGIDRQLFETLLESPDIAALAVEAIDPDWLQSTTAKMLLSAYQELDLQARELTAAGLVTMLDNEFLKNEVITLLDRIDQRTTQLGERPFESPEVRYTAILTRYREREFVAESDRQIEKLKSAVLAEDEELALLEQLVAAQRIRQNPR